MFEEEMRALHHGGSDTADDAHTHIHGKPLHGPVVFAGRNDGEPTILLSHHPDYFFEAAACDVDLTLSGHTHGGQIRVRGKAPLHHSKFGYEQGWFVEGDARLFVSRGVGVTFLPIRIDAPPEAPILTCVAPQRNEIEAPAEVAAQLVESSSRV